MRERFLNWLVMTPFFEKISVIFRPYEWLQQRRTNIIFRVLLGPNEGRCQCARCRSAQ